LHHPIGPPDQVERRLAGGSYRSPIIQGRVAIARWSLRVSRPVNWGSLYLRAVWPSFWQSVESFESAPFSDVVGPPLIATA
jgi:hypothetical protein